MIRSIPPQSERHSPQEQRRYRIAVLHRSMHDAVEIARAILEPVQVPYDLTAIDLAPDQTAADTAFSLPSAVSESDFSLSLGLEDGLNGADLSLSTHISPASACRGAIMALGVHPDDVGIIAESGTGNFGVPGGRLRAEVERGNPRSAGAALASLSDAEALVLFSPRFGRSDHRLFSRMSRRPVILLRDALSAEATTLMASNSPGLSSRVSDGHSRVRLHDVRLTRREQQVLTLLSRGMSSKEISTELSISPRTVDIYRAAILGKMRVRNTPQLMWLLREGQQDAGGSV